MRERRKRYASRPGRLRTPGDLVADKRAVYGQPKGVQNVSKGESEWGQVLALVKGCHEKRYAPPVRVWEEITAMAEELAGRNEEQDAGAGELEDSFRYTFEQDGFSPDEAQKMAESAVDVKPWELH